MLRKLLLLGVPSIAIAIVAACSSFNGDPQTVTVPDASTDAPVVEPFDAPKPDDDAGQDAAPEAAIPIPYSELVFDAGPLAYWRMNADGGDIADESGNDTATLLVSGKATYGKTGVDGTSIGFDGTTTRMTAAQSVAFQFANTDPFTVELWVRRTTAITNGSYLLYDGPPDGGPAGDDRWFLRLVPSGSALEFGRGGTPIVKAQAGALDADAKFHHAAAIYDGNTIVCFLDGQPSSQFTALQDLSVNSRTLLIGLLAGGNQGFKGDIDEVAIYARALSPNVITAHYEAGRPH